MSEDTDDHRKSLSRRPQSPNYEVGYAKPPVETRFRPGSSGNRRGRPRGSGNRSLTPTLGEERLKAIVLEEAYRKVRITEGSRPLSIPMAQAVVRSLAVSAAKGNQRAQRLFTELLASVEREDKKLRDEWLKTAIEYKIDWEHELERRKHLGIDAPAPLPHPDDIIIDTRTGGVRVMGPMTKEDKVVWDQLRARKEACDLEIAELEKLLRKKSNFSFRQVILDEIEREKKLRASISRVIPD
jgi:hypothetical protein